MPVFSIIVPVYNSERDLRKCLDSLVGQTLSDIEIIVVNDGSTDSSQSIIDEYKERFPEMIKAYYQENSGQSAARNFGIEQAAGEYLLFVDSDDYVSTSACERTYEIAKAKDLDILCFDFYMEEEGGQPSYYSHCAFPNINDIQTKYIICETSPWNKIIRRKLFTENGLRFLENYIYEDFELIPRLALYTEKIDFVDEAFYYYIIHNTSTMRQKTYNKKLQSIYYVLESLENHFKGTAYTDIVEYMYIEHLLHMANYRFIEFPEGRKDVHRISSIIKEKFPRWRKNKYYKMQGWKTKLFCNLAYLKQIKLLKFIMKR